MKRSSYRVLMGLLQAPLFLKLLWRGRKEPLYRAHIKERFGHYDAPFLPPNPPLSATGSATPSCGPTLWLHAVSLGETHASAPLVAALRQAYPGLRLVLTHSTATGRQAGAALLTPGDVQVWAPWDSPGAIERFLAHFRPTMGLLMETEVWPQWVHCCAQAGIPLVLVNARMSERSMQRTLRWGMPLMRETYQTLVLVLPQTAADARRLGRLGARLGVPTGNMKFDSAHQAALQTLGQQWRTASRQAVIMLASAREGEEALLFQALKDRPQAQAFQWLLVPRHPQRFDEVAQLARQHGFMVSRRSEWAADGPPPASANEQGIRLWLGDSLGEMPAYYSLAHCALMGGTFLPFGGQNLIEACHYACPVLLGPSTFNFAQAAEQALDGAAALQMTTLGEAVDAAVRLVANPDGLSAMQARALQFAQLHSGATARTLEALAPIWPLTPRA